MKKEKKSCRLKGKLVRKWNASKISWKKVRKLVENFVKMEVQSRDFANGSKKEGKIREIVQKKSEKSCKMGCHMKKKSTQRNRKME